MSALSNPLALPRRYLDLVVSPLPRVVEYSENSVRCATPAFFGLEELLLAQTKLGEVLLPEALHARLKHRYPALSCVCVCVCVY